MNLGVLVSGTGSNLQAIIDAIENNKLDANIKLVICNKSKAKAIERAKKHNIPVKVIKHSKFKSRDEFEQVLVDEFKNVNIDYIVLAGFMRVLTSTFLNAFNMKVINIHPALLPSFKGVDAQQQAIDYGVCVTGCTVHFVDEGTDTGPIIAQTPVLVELNDTRDNLAHRILEQEHILLPTVLQWIAQGRVQVVEEEGKRPRILKK